ncbi:uncharacterized protein LOC143858387 isoform X2 [Tasmannia lanceolata]|uniref:uncharacterized protein LOC143858387 isoform X2 n=1 Tax=Tasmannia lanceolata TaxID=3420 RepID=UPI0040631152
MLENPPEPSIKRYAPPSQRNRLLNRRKSGERLERINYSYGNDGEKSQLTPPTNISVLDHGEAGNNSLPNKSLHQGLIPVGGCCSSAAAQLLSEQRPVMYSGASGSAWGHSKLSHQMDFLAELRRAIRNANAGTATNQS